MCFTLTPGKLIRTAGPSVQRPEQSDAKVTSAMEPGSCTGRSSTVSGWAGSSSHLELLALQLPFLEAGLFFTFRAASFEGAETLTAAGLGTARPLPLPMSTAAIGKLIWTMAEKGGGGAHDQLKKCRKQAISERKSYYYINAARANLSTSHGTLRLVECFV